MLEKSVMPLRWSTSSKERETDEMSPNSIVLSSADAYKLSGHCSRHPFLASEQITDSETELEFFSASIFLHTANPAYACKVIPDVSFEFAWSNCLLNPA